MAVYVDHVALKCSDVDETLEFFQKVFGMTIKEIRGAAPSRKIWTNEGLQLNEVTVCTNTDAAFDHVGFHVEDISETMKKAVECGATPIKGKEDHWFVLPNGLVVELMP